MYVLELKMDIIGYKAVCYNNRFSVDKKKLKLSAEMANQSLLQQFSY